MNAQNKCSAASAGPLPTHEVLTVPEAACLLRIARSRAYELVDKGEIPSVRIGRSIRIFRHELIPLLKEQRRIGVK